VISLVAKIKEEVRALCARTAGDKEILGTLFTSKKKLKDIHKLFCRIISLLSFLKNLIDLVVMKSYIKT
jgi:hypothetical protein